LPTAYIDRIDSLSLVEKLGVIRSLTRKARVVWGVTETRPPDFSVLTVAMSLMPAPFSTISGFGPFAIQYQGFDALVLTERSPTLSENDPGCVDVILKYEHLLDGPNQQLRNPPSGLLFGKGRCSITEKTTNFYRPFGDPTAERVQILVGHTYSPFDPGPIAQGLTPYPGPTVVQGGEINIPFPQGNFQLNGVLTTKNPWATAYQFVASINAGPWLNQPELTWICSEVQWDILDPLQNSYRFSFEFQYNIDTWDPTVIFTDQRSGRPPYNVVKATNADGNGVTCLMINPYSGVFDPLIVFQPAGYWSVPALRRVDFNALFGALFEGFNAPGVM
jgi:hypothetical protein